MRDKSTVAITSVRTGNGDDGYTKLGGKSFRKAHPVVRYVGTIDKVQALSSSIPDQWGEFYPRRLMQELCFRLGAAMGARHPKEQELALQEISRFMENQISYITGGLKPLDSFIASHELNADLHLLRATVREAEVNAIAARDHLELEAKDTSEQMLYMLEKSSVALNILGDWVFAFLWLYSTDEGGTLVKGLRWVPFSDEELRLLND